MDRTYLHSMSDAHCQRILQILSHHQYLHPHQGLHVALEEAGRAVGFCPNAADQALRWLRVDPSQSIGRLQRTQLLQLARSIERFWQQGLMRAAAKARSA